MVNELNNAGFQPLLIYNIFLKYASNSKAAIDGLYYNAI
jgi:hypothetical protein